MAEENLNASQMSHILFYRVFVTFLGATKQRQRKFIVQLLQERSCVGLFLVGRDTFKYTSGLWVLKYTREVFDKVYVQAFILPEVEKYENVKFSSGNGTKR